MRWPTTVALGLCTVLALILRVPDLDQRPFHNDEAVNAIKFRNLFQQGDYRYDPNEYHGPSLHYATLCLARLSGWGSFESTNESNFRWLSLLAGVALIPLLGLVRDGLGRSGTLWAGVLTALSPSLTFYSRDYIHESFLVAGAFLLVGCIWRLVRNPSWKWAAGVGLSLALMQSTKETFVLNVSALGGAGAALMLWRRCEASHAGLGCLGIRRQLWVVFLVWFGVAALLLSSFGSNPAGLMDSVRTYAQWFNRAGGDSVHTHPLWFYAQRLFWRPSGSMIPWTELGILFFAIVGGGAAFLRRGLGDSRAGLVQWLTVYTIILFTLYSFIPYKTPWCILSASHGLVLLAGVGLGVLWRQSWRASHRLAAAVVTLLMVGQLSWQAWALSHSQVSSRQNPWAYADTVPDIRNLLELVEEVAAFSGDEKDFPVQVICVGDDYWPLPYYLRSYTRVGWWNRLPPEPLAPGLIVSQDILSRNELEKTHELVGTFQLRYGVFRFLLVERQLWQSFLLTRQSDGFRR